MKTTKTQISKIALLETLEKAAAVIVDSSDLIYPVIEDLDGATILDLGEGERHDLANCTAYAEIKNDVFSLWIGDPELRTKITPLFKADWRTEGGYINYLCVSTGIIS